MPLLTSNSSVIKTPTTLFRKTPSGAMSAFDENGSLNQGLSYKSQGDGYWLVQNEAGDTWAIDKNGLMYFYCGK